MKIKYDILKYEIDEREELLFCYNEIIASARLTLEEWRKVCKEVQDEFLRVYDENQRLQKLVHNFKSNDDVYLNIQKYR